MREVASKSIHDIDKFHQKMKKKMVESSKKLEQLIAFDVKDC